jgi:hypothetical protein
VGSMTRLALARWQIGDAARGGIPNSGACPTPQQRLRRRWISLSS